MTNKADNFGIFIGGNNTLEIVKLKPDQIRGHLSATFKGIPSWFILKNISDENVGPELSLLEKGLDTGKRFFLFWQSTDGEPFVQRLNPADMTKISVLETKLEYAERKLNNVKELAFSTTGGDRMKEKMKDLFKTVKETKQEGSIWDTEFFNNLQNQNKKGGNN